MHTAFNSCQKKMLDMHLAVELEVNNSQRHSDVIQPVRNRIGERQACAFFFTRSKLLRLYGSKEKQRTKRQRRKGRRIDE